MCTCSGAGQPHCFACYLAALHIAVSQSPAPPVPTGPRQLRAQVFSPSVLVEGIRLINRDFRRGKQQDAHECLLGLILRLELNFGAASFDAFVSLRHMLMIYSFVTTAPFPRANSERPDGIPHHMFELSQRKHSA